VLLILIFPQALATFFFQTRDRRTEGHLDLCITPIYQTDQIPFKLCFLNARSLHRHIDVRKDLNYSSTDICIFSETRFNHSDRDSMYVINGYSLFRNDSHSTHNTRPYGCTAVYIHIAFIPGCIHTVIILMVLR
jgi:hypothetical protein